MLFNSFEFLFLFFPLSVLGYRLLCRWSSGAGEAGLVVASLVFYASWNVRFLPLLLCSITLNYAAGQVIAAATAAGRHRAAGVALILAVAADLIGIGIFKYANFFVDNANLVLGSDLVIGRVLLPLGISFFTFEQISYLVDVRRGRSDPGEFLRYCLFVSFFPRVVAGPILRYREIAPQLAATHPPAAASEDLMVGLSMFSFGLLKKSVLADGIAPFVGSPFLAAAQGVPVDCFTAWGGALAYACQIYFDFSGYSDMAIGAARCFGIRFPANFDSPYKATSVIEFWRRWHMTLSRFLRDYLYISLGGNRRGRTRRYLNLMITMLLGGLWHGANWTFVIWGGLHGAYLMINHGWLAIAATSPTITRWRASRLGIAFGFVTTFLSVIVAWVFFRAPTFATALHMLAGMAGVNGAVLPNSLASLLQPFGGVLTAFGITFGEGAGTEFVYRWLWIVVLLAIAFLAPNTQQVMAAFNPVLDPDHEGRRDAAPPIPPRYPLWTPSRRWAVATGLIAFAGIASITRVSEFLYWQF